MGKKTKLKPVDGLGPYELKRIRTALRDVWRYTKAHKLVKQRCIGKDGFPRCENCKKKTPAITVDHIKPCGVVDRGFIERLFIPSKYMQGLCKDCHKIKTKRDNAETRIKPNLDYAVYTVSDEVGDFF